MNAPVKMQSGDRMATAVQTGTVMLGLLLVAAVVYLLIALSLKLLGIVLLLGGLWTLVYFPSVTAYQTEGFLSGSRMIGLALFTVGILLLIFG